MKEKITEFSPEIIKDPLIFEQNRLSAHAEFETFCKKLTVNPFGNETEQTFASNRILSLDGVWKFAYAENPASVVPDFWERDFDCQEWNDIKVPGHMQLQGYDIPHYTNCAYPWDGKEAVELGAAPEKFNPVGEYVKYFEIPEEYIGQTLR
ncbi:MAG: beta-galactosidase, partial [Lachnospiraceae bacterium]|nr:beta-galactosidase [Lachnospiraceae bacterium]